MVSLNYSPLILLHLFYIYLIFILYIVSLN
nr:MAG TPA: hypothetical protein [Caudoviricetes sp.]